MKREILYLILIVIIILIIIYFVQNNKKKTQNDTVTVNSKYRPSETRKRFPVNKKSRLNGNTSSGIQPWIDNVNDVWIYKFNVFNNDPSIIDQNKLQTILNAQVKDCNTNMIPDYNSTIDVKLYTQKDMKNPDLFKGDRMPVFIGDYADAGGFHYVNTDKLADKDSWVVGDGNLTNYGINVPLPPYTPYIVIDSTVQVYYSPSSNTYGLTTNTFSSDSETYYQGLSAILSHEFHEVIINDDCVTYIQFDQFAPLMKNMKYGEFNSNDDCTNGKRDSQTGRLTLPSFNSKFPSGGMFFVIKEAGDAVSSGISLMLNSYKVDGWLMQNYPLPTFWEPYNTSSTLKYDKLGYVKTPLVPYGGLHAYVYFYSFDTFTFYLMEIVNNGPVTNDLLDPSTKNNFPADYLYARISVAFQKGMNLQETFKNLQSKVWKKYE